GAQSATGAPGAREKRQDSGADLIIRNLGTGEEVTVPDVTEDERNRNGDWIAYAVSSADAAKYGAFAPHSPHGAVKRRHAGPGHNKSLAFDENGTTLAFLSDEAEYAQKVSPYRLYYWKTPTSTGSGQANAAATELVSATTPGMPKGLVASEFAPPRFSKDGAR